jgi:putative aldouronate transport system permease protein
MRKETLGEKTFNIFNVTLMCILMAVTIYPVLYVLFVSFSVPMEYMKNTQSLLWRPIGFSLESYAFVFKNGSIWSGYRNTLFIVVVGTIINMIMTIAGAYVLSRRQLGLRRFLSLATLFTRYFSGGMIPSYLIVKSLGLNGSLWALIFPVAINTFNLIIMRTAFEGVPESLEESAKLDGASQRTIMIRIMVPLVVPTIAVLVLYYGVSHWNSWFNALLYIRKREMYPLQLILRELIIQNSSAGDLALSGDDDAFLSETIKYSTIVISTVPILLLYPFLQRYFIKGVMVGAVKG